MENHIKSGRHVGNSTRQIDLYIQKLFEKGTVTVIDHHNTMQSNIRLTELLRRRLHLEHQHIKLEIKHNVVTIKQ